MNKLSIIVSPEIKGYISDFLLGIDAQGVSEEETADGMTLITALFETDADINFIVGEVREYQAVIKGIVPSVDDFRISFELIDRSSWEVWKSMLKTVRVTPNMVVLPPWEDYTPENNEVVIEINPSLAFGTGHHETTMLCLEAIEELCREHRINSVTDIGCGSGILGIAAAKIGVKKIISLDNDHLAIRETVSNINRNSVSDQFIYFCGTVDNLYSVKADIVVANISVASIMEMKSKFPELMNDPGFLILSGITVTSEQELDELVNNGRIHEVDRKVKGEWLTLILKN